VAACRWITTDPPFDYNPKNCFRVHSSGVLLCGTNVNSKYIKNIIPIQLISLLFLDEKQCDGRHGDQIKDEENCHKE